jgi:hypothetical protein
MQMHENCLLLDLDAIQVQRRRESKKRRKIDGKASRWLTWVSLGVFYHKRNSSPKQVSTLNMSKSRYSSQKRSFVVHSTYLLCVKLRQACLDGDESSLWHDDLLSSPGSILTSFFTCSALVLLQSVNLGWSSHLLLVLAERRMEGQEAAPIPTDQQPTRGEFLSPSALGGGRRCMA